MSSFHLLTGMFISLFFGPDFIRKKLEKIVQKQLGSDISVFAFGSARSSLALCLQAIDKRERNEVLMSAYTCLAVPTAGLAAGFVPYNKYSTRNWRSIVATYTWKLFPRSRVSTHIER